MYRKKWNDKGVSPVIATILMVAITVVLAAVLYVMVIGFQGSGTQTPSGTITKTEIQNTRTQKIYLGAFNPDTLWTDLKIITSVNGASEITWTVNSHTTGTVNITSTDTGNLLSGKDLAGDNKISTGDYLSWTSLSGFTSGSTYKIQIIYVPSGSVVCEKTFTR